MSKTKRILGLLVALVVVAGLVAGVAYWSMGLDLDKTERGLFVNGQQADTSAAALTFGEYEVSFNEYRYFYLTAKYSLSGGDDSYWNHDPDGSRAAYLKETVEDYLQYYYTWIAIADEYGIELTEDELAEIDATIEEQKALYGTNFQSRLDGFYIADEETYRNVNILETRAAKAIEEIYAVMAEEHYDELLATIVTAQHILVKFADFEDDGILEEADEEDEAAITGMTAEEKALELATYILSEIRASSDPVASFATLRAEYDADAEGQPEEGYTFSEGKMVDSFYQAALALEEDEISGLVESTYGYHIILRTALNEAEIADMEDFITTTESLVYEYVVAVRDEAEEALEIAYGPYYESIGPGTVK